MASSDIFTAVVERTRVEEPWGLRIEGGTDCRQPFSVCKVRQLHQFVLYSPSYKLKLQISQAQSNRQTDTSECQFFWLSVVSARASILYGEWDAMLCRI